MPEPAGADPAGATVLTVRCENTTDVRRLAQALEETRLIRGLSATLPSLLGASARTGWFARILSGLARQGRLRSVHLCSHDEAGLDVPAADIMRALRGAGELTHVSLQTTSCGEMGLALEHFPRLARLCVTRSDGESLWGVGRSRSLRELTLWSALVDDDALASLEGARRLERLRVVGGWSDGLTPAAVIRLVSACPKLDLVELEGASPGDGFPPGSYWTMELSFRGRRVRVLSE